MVSRRGSAAKPVTDALNTLVAEGALTADPLQQRAALALDRVATELADSRNGRGLLGLKRPEPVRGAYLVGDVGRGKTMLMDLFFAGAPIAGRQRAHFHEFMDEVHAAIAEFRSSRRARDDDADPVGAAVRAVLGDTRLLCLDEFQVQDITNAMLLGRLFGKLWDRGMTVVATSNTMPRDLYRDGLNRQLVLPFIAELRSCAPGNPPCSAAYSAHDRPVAPRTLSTSPPSRWRNRQRTNGGSGVSTPPSGTATRVEVAGR